MKSASDSPGANGGRVMHGQRVHRLPLFWAVALFCVPVTMLIFMPVIVAVGVWALIRSHDPWMGALVAWCSGLVAYTWWFMRRQPHVVELTDEALRLRFFIRRPVDIPWQDIRRVENPARNRAFWPQIGYVPVHVSQRYGGKLLLFYALTDFGALCDEISARADG